MGDRRDRGQDVRGEGGGEVKIILQSGESNRECLNAWKAARSMGLDIAGSMYADVGDVPVGDVEFCENIMRLQGIKVPTPDFYPRFLSQWFRREIRYKRADEEWACSLRDQFIKPAGRYKSEPARILPALHPMPHGFYAVSEVVTFVQEWRYYVSNGTVVAAGWYDGDNEDEPAPDLAIEWPAEFCGAVDFGRLDTGEIALVESHHPYACGWYGENDQSEVFLKWLIDGWESLKWLN